MALLLVSSTTCLMKKLGHWEELLKVFHMFVVSGILKNERKKKITSL